ncbi:MAG: hypothetical protein BMS9Abin25_1111 [Gammaproteobacteria bacterium]|nr:MAG: hypothetical protein BMS9Abin25_1111 [Gammaproteobacteria bacterium]
MGRLTVVPEGDSFHLSSQKMTDIKTRYKHEEYEDMINPIKQKTVAAAVGSLLIGSVAGISTASAASPFAMTSMESGYMVAEKAGEGKCGAGMEDGKAMKEGKCGGDKTKAKKEGKCGSDKAMKEGKCGEGMEDGKAMKEGKCGGDKAKAKSKAKEEGKCGEGKCGGSGM